MIDVEKAKKAIDDYLENVTLEQLNKDLKAAGMGYYVGEEEDAVAQSKLNDGLSDMPMTLGDMVERAAKHLPEGYIIDIQIEKDGYGVGLITENGRLDLDGGDGMISDINEGISVANGFGR